MRCAWHPAMRPVVVAGLVLAASLSSTSCVGLSQRVDRSALSAVPNEERLLLFDAEHAVFIARDDADLAARGLQDAKAALRRAHDYERIIDERRKGGATVDTVAVLDLLGQWNHARIEMREREVALREAEVDAGDTRLWAARARYEHEKARLVKEKNPAVGANIDLKAFDEQATSWTTREAEAQKKIDDKNADVVTARAAYFDFSRRLQEASHGAYGGPWADLLD